MVSTNFLALASASRILQYSAIADSQHRASCPVACDYAEPGPSAWTHIFSDYTLQECNAVSLFDVNIYVPVTGPEASIHLRACSTSALIETGKSTLPS